MDELEILLELDHEGIKSVWLEEAKTEEEKASLRSLLANSDIQFRNMRRIIRRMYRESTSREEDFDNPNWDYRNACEIGYKRALRDLLKLIPKTRGE